MTTLQIGNLEYKSGLHDIQFDAEDEFLELHLKNKNQLCYYRITATTHKNKNVVQCMKY